MPSADSPFPPGARVVAYCRDSGGRDQDLSIPQQEAKIGEWCKAHGYALVRVFNDAARSGTTTVGRDQFLEMFEYLAAGMDVAGVIIWEYARLSRQWDDSMYYLADLRRQGYAVYSLSDPIPEGLEGRLLESIVAWKNARYSADLSRNIRRGKAYVVTALKGWPHNRIPTGYRKVYSEVGTRRDGTPHLIARLEPDPLTAPQVERAFALRARGMSYLEIAQAAPLFRHYNGIADMFTNPVYIGIYDRSGLRVENYCQPIIDLDTWQRVQELAGAPAHPRRIHSPFLLSGLAFCALCGTPLSGHPSNPGFRYYACPNKPYRRQAEAYCPASMIPKEKLEGRVIDRLLELLDQPRLLLDLQTELLRQSSQADSARLDAERQVCLDLDDTLKRIGRVTAAIQAAGHSQALISDLASLEGKRDELQARLFAIANSAPPPAQPVDLATLASDLAAAIRTASGRDLQRLCRLVVVSVRLVYRRKVLTGELAYRIGDVSGSVAL